MLHRHLTHQQFALAAIDDVIAFGKHQDWVELRRAALQDRTVLERVLQVCRAHIADPNAGGTVLGSNMSNNTVPDWDWSAGE